jgi:hypothetical protein
LKRADFRAAQGVRNWCTRCTQLVCTHFQKLWRDGRRLELQLCCFPAAATAKGRAVFCAEIEVYAQADKTTVLICAVDIADLCVDAVTVDNLIFGTGAKPCIAFTGNIDKTNISNG